MIWYFEELYCQQQPNEVKLNLKGIYNQPCSIIVPTIILQLEIQAASNTTIKILMIKNPSFLGVQEEPNSDDIAIKYHTQILKARNKIIRTLYQDILNWRDLS